MIGTDLLARLWRRSTGTHRQPEGFLEDALVVVIQHPEVWPRVRSRFSLEKWPEKRPACTQQDVIETGRTDVKLCWDTSITLVAELKHWHPATAAQLKQYTDAGFDVVQISALRGRYSDQKVIGSWTWADLRALDWPDAPLCWRQFHALLDQMGVVVRPFDIHAMTGIMASWNSWDPLAEWSRRAALEVATVLSGAGFPLKKSSRGVMEQRSERYAFWVYPHGRWREDEDLCVGVGLFVGRPGVDVVHAGIPDFALFAHAPAPKPYGKRLAADPAVGAAAQLWSSLPPTEGVVREHRSGEWEFLRTRSSASMLLGQPDQGQALVNWAVDRAAEWARCGIPPALNAFHQIEQAKP